MRTQELRVSADAFSYLAHQRGMIESLSTDWARWIAAYQESLRADFTDMLPYLPKSCSSILDIGSGLGGINALLNEHFGGDCNIRLLDGERDAPQMVKHAKTFNSMRVARGFLKDNGVRHFNFCTPQKLIPRRADLILSLQSWCFHYPPAVYRDFVRECAHRDTVLITDIRRERSDWMRQLVQYFDLVGVVRQNVKYVRLVFRLRDET